MSCFVADLHYGDITDIVWDETERLPSKLVDTHLRFKEVVDFAASNGKSVIIAGDIFDTSTPKPFVISVVLASLYYALQQNVKVYILPGNHDCDVMWNSLSIFDCVFFHPTVTLITKPCLLEIDGCTFMFAPHIPKKKEAEILESLSYDAYLARALSVSKAKNIVLVSHGYAVGSGVPGSSERVMESCNAITLQLSDPIFKKKLAAVVMGHVHAAHLGTVASIPFASPGSSVPHDFAEAEDSQVAKSFVTYSPDTGLETVPYRSAIREYATAKIDARKGPVSLTAEMLAKIGKFKNKIVKLVIHCTSRDDVNEAELVSAFGGVSRIEYVVKEKQGKSKTVKSDDVFMHSLDHGALLETYLEGREEDEAIKELASTLGKEIIAECFPE